MADRGKPFTDDNFVKVCMIEAANDLSPETCRILPLLYRTRLMAAANVAGQEMNIIRSE
jgi:hypothetical protein